MVREWISDVGFYFNVLSSFLKSKNKKGSMNTDEIVKIVFFVFVLFVMVSGAIYLFWGGGGRLLVSVKNNLFGIG